MRPLDWKDYAFAMLLLIVAFTACGGGYESALAYRAHQAAEDAP